MVWRLWRYVCMLDMFSQKRIFASLTKNDVVYRKLASYTIFCLCVGERHFLNLLQKLFYMN